MSLKAQIQDDVKNAMRAHQRERLAALRLLTAAIKQKEVDERISVDDESVLIILEKMLKQRRESLSQFSDAGRKDLAQREQEEIDVISAYMPEPLGEAELDALIAEAISESGAESMRDMGKVMAIVKSRAQGRADMSAVSARVKASLGV